MGRLGGAQRASWSVLGVFWGVSGVSWGRLRASWDILAASEVEICTSSKNVFFHMICFFFKDSEGPGVALGSKLGLKIVLARHLGASWRLLEASWSLLEPLGGSSMPLAGSWSPLDG